MMDVSNFIRVGSGMFTYSPVGFKNLYIPSGDVISHPFVPNIKNDILVAELKDYNISPNSTHIERAMTWVDDEAKSHNWINISGEFNSHLLDSSGFIFRNMIDESGFYRYTPNINNSGEYIPVVRDDIGNFIYKYSSGVDSIKEINPPTQRFIYSDKNFLKDLNDIYYDVSRRINSKFNDLDSIEEGISLNLTPYHEDFKYYNSGVSIPAINRSSKEGKPYLDTQTEPRTESQIDANPNIDKTQGYGRFFLPRTKLQNFEFLPINHLGGAVDSAYFSHDLVKAGNKQVSIIGGSSLFTNSINVTSKALGENATSKDGGILGNQELGGHWPGLNLTPKQQKVYPLEKDTVGNKILNFRNEMLNQTQVNYEDCLVSYYENIESGTIYNDWTNLPSLFDPPKNDTLTSSFFQNNKFTLHHNYGLELLNNTGRISDTFYADINFRSYVNASLYNFIPCYMTYVGKGTLRNKFGLRGEKLQCVIENYVNHLNNSNGSFFKENTGDVRLVVGRCLTKDDVEKHPLTIDLETSPSGIVEPISIKEMVDIENSGDYAGVHKRVRNLIIQDSIRDSIKNEDFYDVAVFKKGTGYNTSQTSNFLLEASPDFDFINDFNNEKEVLYISVLVDSTPLIPSEEDISYHFSNNHDKQAANYKDNIESLVDRTTWGNNDMLHLVSVSDIGNDMINRGGLKFSNDYYKDIERPFTLIFYLDGGGRGHERHVGYNYLFSSNKTLELRKIIVSDITILTEDFSELTKWTFTDEYSEYVMPFFTAISSFLFDGSSEREGKLSVERSAFQYTDAGYAFVPASERQFIVDVDTDKILNITTGSPKTVFVNRKVEMSGNDGIVVSVWYENAELHNISTVLDDFDFSLRKNHPYGNLPSPGDYLLKSVEKEIEDGLYQSIGDTGDSRGFVTVNGEVEGGVGGIDEYEQAVFDGKTLIYVPSFLGWVWRVIYPNPVPNTDITASCVSWKKTAQWYLDRAPVYKNMSNNVFIPDFVFVGYSPTTTDGFSDAAVPSMFNWGSVDYRFKKNGNPKLSDGYHYISSVTSTMDTQGIGSYNGYYDIRTLDTLHYTLDQLNWSAEGFYHNSWLQDHGGDNFIIHNKSVSLFELRRQNAPKISGIHPGFGFLELPNPVAGDYDNNFTPNLQLFKF